MTFQVKIGSTWVTPPNEAMPSSHGSPIIEGAPIVRWHEPEGRDGQGRPVATSSEMYAVIGRSTIDTKGMLWWYNTVGLGSNVSTAITIKLFNPAIQSWVSYSGRAWRPTYVSGKAGYRMTNFMIRITNLVETDPVIITWLLDSGRYLDTGLTVS